MRGLIGDRRSFPVTHLNWIDPCGDDFWHPAATSYELPAPGTVRQSRETSSKAVVPGNGKPFPDGSKMAKVGWKPKKSPDAPYDIKVPGAVHDVDFMVKDSKRFADSGGWGYGVFKYDAASDMYTPATLTHQPPQGNDAKCGLACHTIVMGKDYVFTELARR